MATKEKAFPALIDLVNDFPPLAGTPSDEVWSEATVIEETMNPIPPPPNPDNVISALTTPDQPTTIHASTGLTADGKAFILIQWDAMTGASAYDVEWKLGTSVPWTYTRVNDTALRVEGLIPNTSYDYSVEAVNAFGVTSGFPSPSSIVTSADSTAPATPSSVVAAAGLRSVIVTFAANTESDLDHYVIEVYSDAGLTALVKTFTGLATVWSYNNGSPQTQYWARVKAVDTSGNSSAWSSTVTATTGSLSNSDVVAGTITGDRILAGSITAVDAVFATGAILSADIGTAEVKNANILTMEVGKITAGTLSAAVILSGSIKTGTSGLRVEQDANGMRLYGYAFPYVYSVGVEANVNTGALTGTLPPVYDTNDILVAFVETPGAVTPATPTGWTQKATIATTGGAGSTNARLTVFYIRATSSSITAPSFSNQSDRQTCFIIAVRGCTTSGDPFDATGTVADNTSNTAASITGITTVAQNALILAGIASVPTSAIGNTEYTAWTDSTLALVTEVKESAVYSGGTAWGCVGMGSAQLATPGATTAVTVTLDTASKKAMWMGALKADVSATINLDASTGNGSFTGIITGSKFYTPRQTGDRGVLGQAGMGQFIGLGVVTYRNADTAEGPFNVSSLVDVTFDHTFPSGAGTGNSTKLWLAAWGSDNNDKSTAALETTPSKEQAAAITLTSGRWKGAIGAATAPVIDFLFYHYNSSAVQLQADVQMSLLDTSSTIGLSGVHQMGDLYRARAFAQPYTVNVATVANAQASASVTFSLGFAATPFLVHAANGSNSTVFNTGTTSLSATGVTQFIRHVDNTNTTLTIAVHGIPMSASA